MKKLVFAACHQRWENDPATLDQHPFDHLLQHFLERYSTLDQAHRVLFRIVSGLNRQARYSAIASYIVEQLKPLYTPDPEEATQFNSSTDEEQTVFKAAEQTAFSPAQAAASPPAPLPTVSPTAAPAAPAAQSPVQQLIGQPVGQFNGMSPYAEVARVLERHPNVSRIHKLIYGTCYQTWENDMLTLQSHPLIDLLEQIHQFAPSLAYLAVLLNQKAATLNRKAEYMQVAYVICEAMRSLYSTASGQRAQAAQSDPEPPPPDETLTAVERPPVPTASVAPSTAAQPSQSEEWTVAETPDPMPQMPPGETGEMTLPNAAMPTSSEDMTMPDMVAAMAEAEMTMPEMEARQLGYNAAYPGSNGRADYAAAGVNADMGTDASPSHKDRSDLFELRLHIIQYTNPLRAKLLLFSGLHHTFDFGTQDWSQLRELTLEDLLRQLFDAYHSIDEVDVNLTRAAYALPNPDEQDAVVSILLRAIAPYYPSTVNNNIVVGIA
jgi:hypothetical protein